MNRQYSLILAVSFMIFYNVANGLYYSDCGSKRGLLRNFFITGCKTDCVLKRGTDVQISFLFTPSQTVTDVVAWSNLFYKGSAYPMGSITGCENGGLQCPLEGGTSYMYKGVWNVAINYPKMLALFSWALIDQDSKNIVCAQFNVTFV